MEAPLFQSEWQRGARTLGLHLFKLVSDESSQLDRDSGQVTGNEAKDPFAAWRFPVRGSEQDMPSVPGSDIVGTKVEKNAKHFMLCELKHRGFLARKLGLNYGDDVANVACRQVSGGSHSSSLQSWIVCLMEAPSLDTSLTRFEVSVELLHGGIDGKGRFGCTLMRAKEALRI